MTDLAAAEYERNTNKRLQAALKCGFVQDRIYTVIRKRKEGAKGYHTLCPVLSVLSYVLWTTALTGMIKVIAFVIR